MPLNTERPLFANLNMRMAVNYAVDRTAYGDSCRPLPAAPFDQYLPPGMPGYEDIDVYPDASGPRAGTRPRRLASRRSAAADHGLLPQRAVTVNLAQYQIVRQNLERRSASR